MISQRNGKNVRGVYNIHCPCCRKGSYSLCKKNIRKTIRRTKKSHISDSYKEVN